MQMVAERTRWCASGTERTLLAWVADRASAAGRHLAPVVAVGRLPDGRFGVDLLRPAGTPLAAALDVLGTPTTGVAVTLSTPLLELAGAARSGAVQLGAAGLDDVVVDDSGAVVLCDRPPGAVSVLPSDTSPPTDHARAGERARAPTPPGRGRTGPDGADGARTALLAARLVWDRVDPRDPARDTVDAAVARALDGDADAVRAAQDMVRSAAAPRPVRWDPPPADLVFGVQVHAGPPGKSAAGPAVAAVLRDLVERGVPIGVGRRLPVRRVLVGVVVCVGLAAAAVTTLGA